MTPGRLLLVATITAACCVGAAAVSRDMPLRDPRAPGDKALVERGLLTLRLDPKRGASPAECGDLDDDDLVVTVGGLPARVTSVERVPRPERHWLLLDISESAEGRRPEAKRSAAEYVREVMTPGIDAAALLTVDEDVLLVAGPTSEPDALARRIEAIPAGGSSGLRDGLDLVLRQVEGDRREQLILYWTDGHDTQSLGTIGDLLATLARAPNATVFPIALLPTRAPISGPPVGSFVFDVARRSGGEVFASSDGRWLDQVRGWIERRFAVSFAPPSDAAGSLELALRYKRCEITVLPDPFARPDAVAGTAPPVPPAWLRWHAKQQKKTDQPRCAGGPGGNPWEWPLASGPDRLTGCVLDILTAPGPLIRGRPEWRHLDVAPVRIGSREARVEAPPLAELPPSLVEALELMVPSPENDPESSPPRLIEGATLLTQRARIATSLFASRADYRDFALSRLARMAEDDLAAIERDFRHAFPGLHADQLAAVARASRAGRRALEASRTPTDADLARVLAAWLGDLPARELMRVWEQRLIDARLGGVIDRDAASRWQRLRDAWSLPSRVRVVAPLVLVRDAERDLVGFWRVVLARPEGFVESSSGAPAALERPDDRLPQHPLGLWLIDEVTKERGVLAGTRDRSYRCKELTYASLDPPWRSTPDRPYRRVRVTVELEGTGDTPGASHAHLDARIELRPDEPVRLVDLAVDVTGDDALRRALSGARGRLVPVQSGDGHTPTELPTHSSPLL